MSFNGKDSLNKVALGFFKKEPGRLERAEAGPDRIRAVVQPVFLLGHHFDPGFSPKLLEAGDETLRDGIGPQLELLPGGHRRFRDLDLGKVPRL